MYQYIDENLYTIPDYGTGADWLEEYQVAKIDDF